VLGIESMGFELQLVNHLMHMKLKKPSGLNIDFRVKCVDIFITSIYIIIISAYTMNKLQLNIPRYPSH
jgi:hypothetical protein